MTEFRKLSERIGKDIYGQAFFAHLCSPYTEPTDYDKFMNSLTPEQLELAKRLKIEEGEG